jgi:hypothetical protein
MTHNLKTAALLWFVELRLFGGDWSDFIDDTSNTAWHLHGCRHPKQSQDSGTGVLMASCYLL